MACNGYTGRPCYGELVAILLIGLGHILVELTFSEMVAHVYNIGACISFVVYLVWRVRKTPGVLRCWGFRKDNFLPAMLAQSCFAAIGVVALVTFAVVRESVFLPRTFWVTLVLYPVWGIAQQFALQNLIARNLTKLLTGKVVLAVTASTLFAVSHYPRLELVVLTFVAGIFFTLIYRRFPNLWAVGIAHGLLGSLAVYLVLQEDPGAAIIGFLTGG